MINKSNVVLMAGLDIKRWTFLSQLCGHIAMWAVRQSPYDCPEGLSEALWSFSELVQPLFDQNGMAKLSSSDIRSILKNNLLLIPEVRAWNERKNGNQAPYNFVSRYDGKGDPDNDFIDLDALIINVARSVDLENEREES